MGRGVVEMLNLSLKRDVVKLGRVVPSLRKIAKPLKWIKPITKTILERRVELAKIAEKAKLIRIHRLKATRFHPFKAYEHPLTNISFVKRESRLALDIWVTWETWDEIVFEMENTLTKRIKGIVKRQANNGYIKFGLKVHADMRRISGDEIVDVDRFASTKMDFYSDDLVTVSFKLLHRVVLDILENYDWHLNELIVVGDKLKE
jgi:hypothetical protein